MLAISHKKSELISSIGKITVPNTDKNHFAAIQRTLFKEFLPFRANHGAHLRDTKPMYILGTCVQGMSILPLSNIRACLIIYKNQRFIGNALATKNKNEIRFKQPHCKKLSNSVMMRKKRKKNFFLPHVGTRNIFLIAVIAHS